MKALVGFTNCPLAERQPDEDLIVATTFIRFLPVYAEGAVRRKCTPAGSGNSAKQHCHKDTPVLLVKALTRAAAIIQTRLRQQTNEDLVGATVFAVALNCQ
jgi:hypothetical protein